MQNVEVHLMHNSIRIGSFPKNCMPQYVHALLKVVLDASLPGGPKKQFLHLVYTEDEVTVMFDDSINLPIANSPPAGTEPLADGEQTSSSELTEPEQPKEGLTLFPDEWCAITVVAGASGGSGDVLLSSVRHLASVTVFYASTYETDYLLVQKSKVDMVMNLFKALGYKLRDRRCASVETEYVSETESSGYDDLAPNTEPLTVGSPRPLINNDLEVGMACIQKADSVSDLAHALPVLINSMFYELSDFFAVSFVDSEVTVVGETNVLERLPRECLATSSRFRVVHVGCEGNLGLGYEEAGIVDSYVRSLQDENIPVCYLCTFLTDYILIDHADFEDAVETWEEHGISVIPG